MTMSEFSESEEEAPNTQDLDFDMWEGQFEFVGPSNNNISVEDLKIIVPTPHLNVNTNGTKKNAAHTWCKDVSGNVNKKKHFYPN